MQTEFEIITQGNIRKLVNGAIINRYCHIVKGAEIGDNVMIGEHCYVGQAAKIGDDTRIQNGVSIYDGVDIGSGVFIGPNVTFTNHHDPRDRNDRDKQKKGNERDKTIVGNNATICAAVTIVAPCKIGPGAMVGAGSIVLRDVLKDENKNGLIKGKTKKK